MNKLLILLVFITACGPSWEEQHAIRCRNWMTRAKTQSDSLNVELSCATMAEAHKARDEAAYAAAMSSFAVGMTAGSAGRR